ncbi:hypothetical protein VPH35_127870 [Triticum aestivum]
MAGGRRGGSSMRPNDGRRSGAPPVARQLEMPSDSDGSTGSKYRSVPTGRTESSASHQATTEASSSSDGDVGVDLDIPDPLATESGDMEASDGSGSTSSNTSKRNKSGRGPGKVPEPTATSNRPVICPTGEGQWEFIPTQPKGARPPNHVIGSLLRKHFPGLSKPGDNDPLSPGLTWEHYLHNKDEHDVTMATRVINAFLKHFLAWMVKEPWMKGDCWEALVDMWCNPAWQAKVGRPVHILEAWREGHKGKDGAEFCSESPEEKWGTFKEVFQEVHGQEAEPTSKPLDPELLIIAGEGKGHGRHLLCNGAIATSGHRKLHEIHASNTSSTPSIQSRPTAAAREIARLMRAIEEEQRRQAEQDSREKEREDTNKRLKLLEDQLQVEHYLN